MERYPICVFWYPFPKDVVYRGTAFAPCCREEEELWCWGQGPPRSPHHFPFLPLWWQRVTSHPVWSAFRYHMEASVDRRALLKFTCSCWAHWCLVPEQFRRQWTVAGLFDSLGLWVCGVAGKNSITRGCCFCWLVNSDLADRAPPEPSSRQRGESQDSHAGSLGPLGRFLCHLLWWLYNIISGVGRFFFFLWRVR